jgi:hypothetical protein
VADESHASSGNLVSFTVREFDPLNEGNLLLKGRNHVPDNCFFEYSSFGQSCEDEWHALQHFASPRLVLS